MVVEELNFDGHLALLLAAMQDKLIVAEFFCSGCKGECPLAVAKFEELSQQYPSQIFVRIDVTKLKLVTKKYAVKQVPAFIFFENKQRIAQVEWTQFDLVETNLKTLCAGSKLKDKPQIYYAVKVGLQPGVYLTWEACQAQTAGFKGSFMREFSTLSEAENFVNDTLLPGNLKVPKLYYAIRSGSVPGIYGTLDEWRKEVVGSSKKGEGSSFSVMSEAEAYVYGTFMGSHTQYSRESQGNGKNDMISALIFVDGVCHREGQLDAAAGCGIYWGDKHQHNVAEPVKGHQITKERALLTAILRAIRTAKTEGYKKLILCTDGLFPANIAGSEYYIWAEDHWQMILNKSKKQSTKEAHLVKAMRGIKITWVCCKTGGWGGFDGAAWLAKQGANYSDKPLVEKKKPYRYFIANGYPAKKVVNFKLD